MEVLSNKIITYLYSTSYNLDDMMLVKCVFHSITHATMDDAVEVNVIAAVAVDELAEFGVADSEVLVRFDELLADEHAVEAVAGLEIVIVVAELEFQYLQ